MSYETYAHAQDMVEVEQLDSISMKGVNREIKVFSVLKKLQQSSRKKEKLTKIKSVSERIGERLDALETKIEKILHQIKWIKICTKLKKWNEDTWFNVGFDNKVLAGLGSLEERVLKEYGFTKIDNY